MSDDTVQPDGYAHLTSNNISGAASNVKTTVPLDSKGDERRDMVVVNRTDFRTDLPLPPRSENHLSNSLAEQPGLKESAQGGLPRAGQENEIASTGLGSSSIPPQTPQKPSQSKRTGEIPELSSSGPESPPTVTPAQGVAGQLSPKTPSRPVSRSGVKGNERNGSISSSRRSKTKEKDTPVRANLPTSPPAASKIPERKKGRGIPRLLSFLNCCSAPEDANPIDSDNQISPPRKTNKLQPSQGRQATPTRKPDASAAESSTAESKEMSDEKIGGPPYSDIKAAELPKIQDREPESSSASQPPTSASQDSKDSKREEKSPIRQSPVPTDQEPIVSSTNMIIPPEEETSYGQANAPGTASPIPLEPSTTTTPPAESVINDRTREQEEKDKDIEMVDAPPEEPVDDGSMQMADSNQALPPPPPLAPQIDQGSSSVGANRSSVTSANALNERQTWLLPPVRPEFYGKKCLVLDLDETLVHASFKVWNHT